MMEILACARKGEGRQRVRRGREGQGGREERSRGDGGEGRGEERKLEEGRRREDGSRFGCEVRNSTFLTICQRTLILLEGLTLSRKKAGTQVIFFVWK